MNNKLDEMFQNDFMRLPRPLIRKFNLNTAVMLSEIYSEYMYWEERKRLLNTTSSCFNLIKIILGTYRGLRA